MENSKPFLSDRVASAQKATLIDNDKIVKNDDDTARVLNAFFSNIISDLQIPGHNNCDTLTGNVEELVLKAIVKYRNHLSLLTIREVCKKNPQFSFRRVDEILKEFLNLDPSKACQDLDIPSRIITENADIFTVFLHSSFNNSIYQSEFPSILKLANITPVFEKGDRNSKENYRPVNIPSNISEIFEQCMFCQISSFMDSYLSKQQCGFRNGYSTQYCLLVILEKWKNAADKGKFFGALPTNLSKAFDYLSQDLLIAKVHACVFDLPALKLIQNYLSNRKQKTKINATYSSWEEILFRVPQGSVLGPLSFNIFLCDLLWTMCETGFEFMQMIIHPMFRGIA